MQNLTKKKPTANKKQKNKTNKKQTNKTKPKNTNKQYKQRQKNTINNPRRLKIVLFIFHKDIEQRIFPIQVEIYNVYLSVLTCGRTMFKSSIFNPLYTPIFHPLMDETLMNKNRNAWRPFWLFEPCSIVIGGVI